MAIFNSQQTTDTHPHVDGHGNRWSEPFTHSLLMGCGPLCDTRYDPRPEFDNNPNPILLGFRKMASGRDPKWLGYAARLELTWLDRGYGSLQAEATPEQVEHARRVLQRIAGTHTVSHRVPV